MYTDLDAVVPLHGCQGDGTMVCDDVALESKFPVDIVDYRSSMHVSLFVSLQGRPPGGGPVFTY